MKFLAVLFALLTATSTFAASSQPVKEDVSLEANLYYSLPGMAHLSAVDLSEKVSSINELAVKLAAGNDISRCTLSDDEFAVNGADIRVFATLRCTMYSFSRSKTVLNDALMDDMASRQLSILAGITAATVGFNPNPAVSGSN